VKTILLALAGLILALPAAAQPAQDDQAAMEAERRERAIERCEAERGVDCRTNAGLAEWLASQRKEGDAGGEARLRQRAIARCRAERGVDCESEAGLAEWILQERSRGDARDDGSRSIHQTAPRPSPR
jgi:hypothetical protein